MTSLSPIPIHPDPTPAAAAATDVDDHDALLGFVEYARSTLWPEDEEKEEEEDNRQTRRDVDDGGAAAAGGEPSYQSQSPPWSWIVSRVLKTCVAYPSGVTSAILLSDLSQGWSEQNRHVSSKRRAECVVSLGKRRQRRRLPNTVTINSIYDKNFLSEDGVLEVVILDAFLLPGTNIYILKLGDIWSSCTIDLYLHRRYYNLVTPDNGILRKGREIFLTGCCLRSAMEGHGHPRLLPTEYLVILLDEDQDEDAMLLGAQFCSDSFTSISLDAFKAGFLYAFYARIESIGPTEVQGNAGSIRRKQITLVDTDGIKIKFLLWGEQVLLANFFSVGSMLAVDKPFISSAAENNVEACGQFCLEYGSDTHVYLVPFVRQGEPVLLNSTQIRYQGSRLVTASDQSSRMSMPLDYEGSIDLKNYPFRSYVTDLHDKMTGISLYGVVTSIYREANFVNAIYSMTIKDATGAIVVKLHFLKSWSLGRVGLGHAIYISGLICSMTTKKQLEASWFENDPGAYLVNLSCLPAVPNSSCLHKLSSLCNLSSETYTTHICTVRLDQIEHHQVNSRLSHAICGHFVDDKSDGVLTCDFCSSTCDGEVHLNFDLKVIIADDSAKVSAWCSGPTAAEMLQICPDDFCLLPEDEQAMYLYTLENEGFIVVLVNCKPLANGGVTCVNPKSESVWEIVHVQKT